MGQRDVRSGLWEGVVVYTSTVHFSEYPTPRRPRLLCRLEAPGGDVEEGKCRLRAQALAPDLSVVRESQHVCQQRRPALPGEAVSQVKYGCCCSIVCIHYLLNVR